MRKAGKGKQMETRKTAIVTGATRGIGKAIALELAKEGMDIAVIATAQNERSEKALEEIGQTGVKVRLFTGDVSVQEDTVRMMEQINSEFEHVAVLVNNAGITRDSLLLSMKEEDIDRVIDVNLKGCMYMTKACLRPFMKQKKGAIVNISSVVGLMGNAGQANYAAAKAGIIGFTKTIAREYAAKNIRCNAIAPGFICTDMTAQLPPEAAEQLKSQIPLKRLGAAEEVAHLAAFLAGDKAAYITGEVIKVDGGMYI